MTKPERVYVWGLVAVGLAALAPLLIMIPAAIFATVADCRVDEGSVHPCVVAGYDFGSMLYGFGVLPWLAIATIPMGAIAATVCTIGFGIWRARAKKQAGAGSV